MCLLIVVVRPGHEVPLVVGANRDEQLARPAVPMVVHAPGLVGGRDELAGGTWLAASDAGVVAALTNKPVAGGRDAAKRSRGELPLLLAAEPTAAAAAKAAGELRPGDFNPCWMVVGDRDGAFTIDMTGERSSVRPLPPGVTVVENREPGLPSPKVDHVRRLLEGAPDDGLEARVRAALGNHDLPPGPTAGMEAGIPEATEATGSACVHTETYGTRWSGVVGVPRAGRPAFRYADGPPCTTPFVDVVDWGR